MSRIGATVASAQQYLLYQLSLSNREIAGSSSRLASGQRINSAADDISGFMRLSKLQDRLSQVRTTINQVNSAATLASETQLTLDQVRTQLDSVRTTLLTDEARTLTATQRTDAQTSIDTALDEIDSLAGTEVNGRRVLDGTANFTVSGQSTSQMRQLDVYSVAGGSATISGSVTSTATQASVAYTGSGSRTTAAANFTLTGARGSYTFSVVNNQLLTSVRDNINQYSHKTGITATASGNTLTFTTVDYGSSATIDVAVSSGTFNTSGTTTGTDAVATINGTSYTGSGNRFDVNSNGTRVVTEFVAGFTGSFNTVSVSDGETLKYALTTDVSRLTKLGLPSVMSALFRGISGGLDSIGSGGSLSGLNTNTSAAIRVVDEALSRLTAIEARVDSFANASVANASELYENLETTLEDAIDDLNLTDEDEENAIIAKYETLSANATSSLAILQQQQSAFVSMLQQIAGL